ncbi:hypothetical protein [Granulicella tundricola]|uniref:HNH endonuclease n=1 Tax=Granulicella tundricola (strain ATCC BAA-1859 / DSM 23138 / MP5ACTX9) TaxID=1198114 RepID=E8WWN8_GRATM|nr:hypothetical protein [Granulicella tundricola]ADW70783.1 hypothetical protein AciX9_3783 [Granulicella tundricola MP5ACTX9]
MPSLTEAQREKVLPILAAVRTALQEAAEGDLDVLHQMRRYVGKRLEFDERGTPTQRRKLHELKWKSQQGICALCPEPLPERGAELDRLVATAGYTEENTRLVHHACHLKITRAQGVS